MSVKTIESSEIIELLPPGGGPYGGSQSKFQKNVFGSFSAKGFELPNIYVMELSWHTDSDLIIYEPEDLGSTIDFSFMMQGGITSDFNELKKELVLTESQHNFKFSPGKDIKHKMVKGEQMNVFQVSLEKGFFSSMIGHEDKWSENLLRKLEKQEPFFGGKSSHSVTPLMRHLIQSLKSVQDQGSIGNLRRQSLLFELLAIQLEQVKQLDTKSEASVFSVHDQEKLHALRLYVEQHFLDDLSLNGLSRISTLNEFKLKKGFKALFNTSVFEYIKQLRMEHASRLIRDDRKTIEEVAAILGYEYANHFSAAFKKHYGSSPSSW